MGQKAARGAADKREGSRTQDREKTQRADHRPRGAQEATGPVRTRENTGAVRTRENTGAVRTQENTGPVRTRENTGAVRTRENTGAVRTRENTGAVRTRENTGAVRTRENTGAVRTRENTGPVRTQERAAAGQAAPRERKRKKADLLRYAANICAAGILAYFAVGLITRLITRAVFAQFHKDATLESPIAVPEWVLGLVNLLLPALALSAAFFFIRSLAAGGPLAVRIRLHVPRTPQLWLFVPVFLGISLLGDLLTSILQRFLAAHTRYAAPEAVHLPDSGGALLLYFAGMCVVPAVFEELLVRGAWQQMLSRWGAWFSIVVSSVTFALMHGDAAQMPAVFVQSVMMGLAAHCTGTLSVGIVLHFANNMMAFCFLYASQAMDGVSALAMTAYLVVVFLLAAAGCAAVIYRQRVMRLFRPIPRVYDPKNRQSRFERLATAPLYLLVMLALAARALAPLWLAV